MWLFKLYGKSHVKNSTPATRLRKNRVKEKHIIWIDGILGAQDSLNAKLFEAQQLATEREKWWCEKKLRSKRKRKLLVRRRQRQRKREWSNRVTAILCMTNTLAYSHICARDARILGTNRDMETRANRENIWQKHINTKPMATTASNRRTSTHTSNYYCQEKVFQQRQIPELLACGVGNRQRNKVKCFIATYT